nr:putative ribonuclease H-like domain-containing protein [Tanacetum cinerariifolium]
MVAKFEAQELEINRLKARVKLLEDREGVAAERSRDDAPIKERNLDEEEAATERVSDDTEEMATVLTSIDVATVLASGVADVPTGNGSIATAGSPAAEEVARELEEQMAREDQRMSEQVARDAEVARILPEEELQMMINSLDRSNETLEDFILIGSKEEAERFKRKGIRGSEELLEDLKAGRQLSQLPIFYGPIEAYGQGRSEPVIGLIEWKLYDLCGVHQVTSKDKEIFMLVEKDYPLRKGLEIVMICYKLQVKNYSQMANDLILKIYKIANYPSQQGEVPTTSEESSHCQKKREATAVKIALLLKSKRNCQSKSDDSYTKAILDRKSTTGGCQFLGCRLISWQCKKQTVVATSSTEAEYVVDVNCCAQVL